MNTLVVFLQLRIRWHFLFTCVTFVGFSLVCRAGCVLAQILTSNAWRLARSNSNLGIRESLIFLSSRIWSQSEVTYDWSLSRGLRQEATQLQQGNKINSSFSSQLRSFQAICLYINRSLWWDKIFINPFDIDRLNTLSVLLWKLLLF